MTNDGNARKNGKRKAQADRRPGIIEGDVDSETLADYVMGNLAGEQKQQLDSRKEIDPELAAEIRILGLITPDKSPGQGLDDEPSHSGGHTNDHDYPSSTGEGDGEITPDVTLGSGNRVMLAKFREILRDAMKEGERELLPRRIIAKAEKAVKDENLMDFLELAGKFTDSKVFVPSERDYYEMSILADMINNGRNIAEGILQVGIEVYPESDLLMQLRIRQLAHSSVAADRIQAKKIVREKYGSEDPEFQLREGVSLAQVDVYVLALMLDAYHRDGQHEEVIRITTRLVEQNQNNDVAMRNHARAMQRLPEKFSREEVLAEYKRAILADDAGDASASWYANALEAFGRPVDALEARVFACMLDLDDALSFATLALTISELVQPRNVSRMRKSMRQLPNEISSDTVVRAIVHAYQCKDYGIDAKGKCQSAMLNIGKGVDDIQEELAILGELSRKDRATFIEKLYEHMRSNVTENLEYKHA